MEVAAAFSALWLSTQTELPEGEANAVLPVILQAINEASDFEGLFAVKTDFLKSVIRSLRRRQVPEPEGLFDRIEAMIDGPKPWDTLAPIRGQQ